MISNSKTTALRSSRRPNYTGILPIQAIRDMIVCRDICAPDPDRPLDPDQLQPASIDLRLGEYAYPVDTSFLPGRGMSVLDKLKKLDPDFERFRLPLADGTVLEKGRVYVVPLLESIKLKSDVAAFANPKSSTGRLDILTRLIADSSVAFDQIDSGYEGPLYIEIAPRSFSIVARTGVRLNQLRFRRTRGVTPRAIVASDWKELLDGGQLLDTQGTDTRADEAVKPGYLPFTIDLNGTKEGDLIGWRAKKNTARIDLDRRDLDPLDYWEPIRFRNQSSLILIPDEFYILKTRETLAVPPQYAAEMLPYDTSAGEFRVHYAGFFDPGFGVSVDGRAGSSRGVLEVRSHEVPFLLEHGQIVGSLRYERMADIPATLYGQGLSSNYQGQSLKLAKQFKQ